MSARFVLVFIVVVTAFVACHKNSNAPTAPTISGLYQYTGYDTTGLVVATGSVTLVRQDSLISGKRNLTGTALEADSGAVDGSVDAQGDIVINFLSQRVGMIYVVGKQSGSTIAGNRYLDTGASLVGRKAGTLQLAALGS